jgi:hypothetical protein
VFNGYTEVLRIKVIEVLNLVYTLHLTKNFKEPEFALIIFLYIGRVFPFL